MVLRWLVRCSPSQAAVVDARPLLSRRACSARKRTLTDAALRFAFVLRRTNCAGALVKPPKVRSSLTRWAPQR
jgi:hypothetical protein